MIVVSPSVDTDPDNPTNAAPFSVAPEQYGSFLCRLFDRWRRDFHGAIPSTTIRFFEGVLHHYVGQTPPECTLLKECGVFVVVEYNGNVYSCDFFVEPEWYLGNIQQDRLIEMLNSEKQTAFGNQKMDLPEQCESCRWLPYCHGGCPKDRIRDPCDNGVSHFCEAYQMFFEHADTEFRILANEIKRKAAKTSDRGETQKNAGRNGPCPCGSGKKYKKRCGR